MAVLMLASRVPQMVTHQRAGRWQKLWGGIVEGRRLTIVGLGALGGAVAAQASHFGLHVTGVRAHPAPHPDCAEVIGQDGLDAALASTEFLVLACPLTPATHKLLDRRRIGLLPKDAGVVNIGRGPLLDQEALCDALDAGICPAPCSTCSIRSRSRPDIASGARRTLSSAHTPRPITRARITS